MTPETIITHIVAGGLLGMLGQGLRVIAGLKKANDEASAQGVELKEVFQLNKLLISLFIGFIAGALAFLTASAGSTAPTLDKDGMIAIVAAGYAGTDFIEAFMKKHLPSDAKPQSGQKPTVNAHDEQPAVG